MRFVFFILISSALFYSCTTGKSVTKPDVSGRNATSSSTTVQADHQNNVVSVTAPVQTPQAPAGSGKVVFEGSNNLFDIIDQNTAYFDQGYDVVIIKGNGNLIRFYNTSIVDTKAPGADTLVLVGNKVKYVMATTATPALKVTPSRIDTIQLKTQAFTPAQYKPQGLEPGSFSQLKIDGLLERVKAEDVEAYYELGDVYNFGIEGVDVNTAKAVSLYEYAATQGDIPSIRRLGDIWFNGTFDQQPNKAKGFFYYKLGAQLGDEYCKLELGKK